MADWSTFLAFIIFVTVMTGTPGPGNLTFMAIGAKLGTRAAMPSIWGANLADVLMNIMVAQGLGLLMTQSGPLSLILKALCMAYMVYLAWRILNMSRATKGDVKALSFWEGALIHPLSPKTWAMNVMGFSIYFTPSGSLWDETAILAGSFFTGGMIFHTLWAYMGASIMKILGHGRVFQAFTATMVALMVGATAWSLWLQGHA